MTDERKEVYYVCALCSHEIVDHAFCSWNCSQYDETVTERNPSPARKLRPHVPYDCEHCEALREDIV